MKDTYVILGCLGNQKASLMVILWDFMGWTVFPKVDTLKFQNLRMILFFTKVIMLKLGH